MSQSVPRFGLAGVTGELFQPSAPAPFETDVPVFIGYVDQPIPEQSPLGKNLPLVGPVTSAADFENQLGPSPGYLSDTIAGFFANGGRRAFIGPLGPADRPEQSLIALDVLLTALKDRLDIDLICAPDLAECPEGQDRIRAHLAGQAPQFAILDLPGPTAPRAEGDEACALYGPWIRIACRHCRSGKGKCECCKGSGVRVVPPCGVVAGTFARVGGRVPANVRLEGVLDTADRDTAAPLAADAAYNPLVTKAGRGVRVWGATTLDGRDIAARRLLQTIERWARKNLESLTFEPNTPSLGLRVRRSIETLLAHMHRTGLLAGATPADAFLVVCDDRNNPDPLRLRGGLAVDVYVQPCRTVGAVQIHLVRVDGRVTATTDSPAPELS